MTKVECFPRVCEARDRRKSEVQKRIHIHQNIPQSLQYLPFLFVLRAGIRM